MEDLDNLLDFEAKHSTGNCSRTNTLGRKVQRSGLSVDINEILELDLDELLPKSSEGRKTTSTEVIKCFPEYIGGTTFPSGCSVINSPKSCTALHCRNCDFKISHFPGHQWTTNVDYIFLRTNMPDYKKVSEKLQKKSGSTAYACHCTSYSTENLKLLQAVESLPWFCRGHSKDT